MANNIYPFKIKNRLMTYETASFHFSHFNQHYSVAPSTKTVVLLFSTSTKPLSIL
jgi:hypothetical protein